MEQRRLRLGDILDDYCPRERRVTNHAVVAMVDEDVKQTRCTTCDAEHVYKGAKAPRKKKTETTGKLYKQVLAGLTDQETALSATTESDMIDEPEPQRQPVEVVADVVEAPPVREDADDDVEDDTPPSLDDGPVHRPLIRAQLPRVEGAKVERQAPDFTIRQASARGNAGFRGGHGQGGSNGHRFGRGPQRGGGRGDANQGFGRGAGGNQPRHGGGPRKRGR
jgi:hypothetical protein